ncbi:FUSC family protein [Microbacterium sp. NPDC089189]|uniref:FUSC family protein n=1 Tax=Microbacterium sp. NPDC089189 TaxID=3154972 RepID=UPI00343793B5
MGERLRAFGAGLVAVAPHRGAHRVALRAAVSIAVPLLVLWGLGRLDLSIYASFGAFAALYGRADAFGDRIRMQAAAALTLIGAMLIGTALSVVGAPAAVRVLVVALVAAVVTLVAAAGRWHPPGALFAVFAAGACATLPATAASFAAVLIVAGAGALFALLLTVALAALRGGLRDGRRIARARLGATAVEMAIAVGAGSALAGLAGLALLGTHWYWAMVAAVAALGGASVTARVVRGFQRLLGTVVGILLAAGLLALHLPPLLIIAAAVLLQVGAELFVGRNYGIAMVFVTPLALLMIELAVPADPALLIRDRILDTLVGVAIGTVVAVLSARVRRGRTP